MPQIAVRVIDCWVFRRHSETIEFLIMKRAPGRQYEDIWHCVHGKIIDGEKAWYTALRELKEETGFKANAMWTADTMSSFYEAEQDRVNLVPVFAVDVSGNGDPILSEEHTEFAWLEVEDAINKVAWENHRMAIKQINYMMQGEDFPQKKWLEIKID